MRAWPSTIALASFTISPDCFFVCSSARLYASVAAPAFRYSVSICSRTFSRSALE